MRCLANGVNTVCIFSDYVILGLRKLTIN